MKEVLAKKLHQHLVENYPDLLLELQQDNMVTEYLNDRIVSLGGLPDELLASGQPAYQVEETCMDQLKRDLGPSKFNFLCSVLMESFDDLHGKWVDGGILVYEVVNLIQECNPLFEEQPLTDGLEEDPAFREVVSGKIREYCASVL